MKIEEIEKLIKEEKDKINTKSIEDLEKAKTRFFGKDGLINSQMKNLKSLSNELKKEFGSKINTLKNELSDFFNSSIDKIKIEKINREVLKNKIDVSLPGVNFNTGSFNILSKTIDEILQFFTGVGFKIIDGPEVETDYYCFEQVNIPKDHIARDMQDTFYFSDSILLRTHTSSNQVREMEKNIDKTKQLAIVSPGKVYRRDTDDATHSHQFNQIEGMLIGKGITLGNLKAVLDSFIKSFYGPQREIRLRTSYFPFTEPSVEVDVSCGICNSKGCSACKEEGWIEILGAGMIHDNVLKNGGYDPDVYSGFAFGLGVERIAMLKYNIKDIRYIYNNDLEVYQMFVGENI